MYPVIAQAGGAIFDNLALIFAMWCGISWSKDNAGLCGAGRCGRYFVMTKAMGHHQPEINIMAGWPVSLPVWWQGRVYNRLGRHQLPDFLSFFGGKRFRADRHRLLLSDPRGVIFGYVWPPPVLRCTSTLAANGSSPQGRSVPVSLVSSTVC
ncbi:PTS transporter subunit EIIC [Klebsiella pneumoniae subsp. pneumoniae]|nr:PTS transporter subunit EIIC [Klebsiella pneumoniae subsp. pneumoniae]